MILLLMDIYLSLYQTHWINLVDNFCFYCRIQDIMKHQHVKGNMMANTGSMTEIEDKFDFIMDANDQLLEKIVNILFFY